MFTLQKVLSLFVDRKRHQFRMCSYPELQITVRGAFRQESRGDGQEVRVRGGQQRPRDDAESLPSLQPGGAERPGQRAALLLR